MHTLHVRIVLKSGNEQRFKCDKITAKRSPITGALISLEWTNLRPRVLHIELDDIAMLATRRRLRGIPPFWTRR